MSVKVVLSARAAALALLVPDPPVSSQEPTPDTTGTEADAQTGSAPCPIVHRPAMHIPLRRSRDEWR
jgi:hypothetical protein